MFSSLIFQLARSRMHDPMSTCLKWWTLFARILRTTHRQLLRLVGSQPSSGSAFVLQWWLDYFAPGLWPLRGTWTRRWVRWTSCPTMISTPDWSSMWVTIIQLNFIKCVWTCQFQCENIVEDQEETILQLFAKESPDMDIELCSKRCCRNNISNKWRQPKTPFFRTWS